MPLEIRPIAKDDWTEAMRLAGRAFVGYAYVRSLFGDDPLDRLAGTTEEYGERGWDPSLLAFGAWTGAALAGTAIATRPGACGVCASVPTIQPPETERLAHATFVFDAERRRAHAPLPPHGHLNGVAVEPVAQRAGVGRVVIRAALDAFARAGGGPMVLECVRPLEHLYAVEGFRTVGLVEDIDEDLLLMIADL